LRVAPFSLLVPQGKQERWEQRDFKERPVLLVRLVQRVRPARSVQQVRVQREQLELRVQRDLVVARRGRLVRRVH
jgi:hypothetical protein